MQESSAANPFSTAVLLAVRAAINRELLALVQPQANSLAALVGPQPRIVQAKFLAPVRPGAQLSLQLEVAGRHLRFTVRDLSSGDRLAASGQFEVSGG